MDDPKRAREAGRGRWWLGAMAMLLLVLGAALPLVLPWRSPVTRASSELIQPGMTRAVVEQLLGGPPGDYRTRPPPPFVLRIAFDSSGRIVREQWEGHEGITTVSFYDDGTVHDASYEEAASYDPTVAELALWRWGRLKERLSP